MKENKLPIIVIVAWFVLISIVAYFVS